MPKMSAKKTIGITGTMGAGKSTAARILSEMIPVIDCDQINADLLLPNHAGYETLVQKNLVSLNQDGTINKAQLAKDMFTSTEYRKTIEQILHPLILKSMKDWMAEQSGLCAVEVPLLFELGLQDQFDEVWCISCDENTALDRLVKYRDFTKEEALARIASQFSKETKETQADVVLYNNTTQEDLRKQILSRLDT